MHYGLIGERRKLWGIKGSSPWGMIVSQVIIRDSNQRDLGWSICVEEVGLQSAIGQRFRVSRVVSWSFMCWPNRSVCCESG